MHSVGTCLDLYHALNNFCLVIDARINHRGDDSVNHQGVVLYEKNMWMETPDDFSYVVVLVDDVDDNVLIQDVDVVKEVSEDICKAFPILKEKIIVVVGTEVQKFKRNYKWMANDFLSSNSLIEVPVSWPANVSNGVYLGSAIHSNPFVINTLGVEVCINCLSKEEKQEGLSDSVAKEFNIKQFRFYWTDSPEFDILNDLPELMEIIDKNISSGILIHCWRGASRSASVVVAYLMWKFPIYQELNTALSYLRTCRTSVSLNPGFLKQLSLWRDIVSYSGGAGNATIDSLKTNVHQTLKFL